LHIVDRNGWLETDSHALVAMEGRPLARPLASIAFDDLWATALSVGAQELNARRMRGTFYVTRAFAEAPGGRYASVLELRQILVMGRGHEFGAHGATHRPLTTLLDSALRQDLEEAHSFLRSIGATADGLAYPLGDFDDRVERSVQGVYRYARTSLFGLNDADTNPWRVRVIPVTTETSARFLIDRIEDAVRTSTWIVLLFHDLGTPVAGNPYRTSVDDFRAVLDRLATGDLGVVTVYEALREIGVLGGG
jgi:peptidoglycan/xylan/chitin deacetylase (PgdA/CDA1 family)